MESYKNVLDFWFEEAGPKRWFKKSATFDEICRARFLPTLEAAARGECWEWRSTPSGRCAEIIVLDPRRTETAMAAKTAASFFKNGVISAIAAPG